MAVVELILIPRVISLVIGLDVTLLLMKMIILLGKGCVLLSSENASSGLVVSVTSRSFGLLVPVGLMRLVEFSFIP